MSDKVLLGAVAPILEKNGYTSSSVSSPGRRGFRYESDEAGIALIVDGSSGLDDWRSRSVVALTLTARNPKVRAELLALLKKRGLADGPQRIGSDDSVTFPLSYTNSYGSLHSRDGIRVSGESDPAIALTADERLDGMGRSAPPNVVRVAGTWANGSPLDIPRSALPALPDDIDALFAAFDAVVESHQPAPVYEYKLPPITQPEKRPKGDLSRLTAVERAPFQAGARGALSHREKARLDRLAASGVDAD